MGEVWSSIMIENGNCRLKWLAVVVPRGTYVGQSRVCVTLEIVSKGHKVSTKSSLQTCSLP